MRAAGTSAPNRGVKRRIDRLMRLEQKRHTRKLLVWLLLFLVLISGSVFVMAKFGNRDSKKQDSASSTRVVMKHTSSKKKHKAKKAAASSKSSVASSTSSSVSSKAASSSKSSSSVAVSSSVRSSSSSRVSSSSVRRSSSSSVRTTSVRATSSSKKQVASSSKPTHYTIKNGDSLYRIAIANHMSLSKLEALNGLKDDANLQPGQQLRIK